MSVMLMENLELEPPCVKHKMWQAYWLNVHGGIEFLVLSTEDFRDIEDVRRYITNYRGPVVLEIKLVERTFEIKE